MLYRIFALAFPVLLFMAQASPAGAFQDTLFIVKDGRVIAPRANHHPAPPEDKDFYKPGWRPERPGDYYSFDTDGILDPDRGSMEIKVTIADMDALKELGKYIEALVTIYDADGTAFFSVGMNDHDVTAGSYPLHANVMEGVFGGTGFPYVAKLDGPLKEGMEITVTVKWGETPVSNKVLINGKQVELAVIKGPRHHGNPPGFEPTELFSKYMHGFTTWYDKKVGPPRLFVIGRVGIPDKSYRFFMYPPRAFAINSVTLTGGR